MDGGVTAGAPGAAPGLGLLHTVPALAPTFGNLLRERAPSTRLVHVVDPWLLDTAVADGVTAAVTRQVAAHVDHLVAAGAAAVLVTCSSIGEAAEAAAVGRDMPVLRVDAEVAGEVVAGAAAARAGGDLARHDRLVAAAVRWVAAAADVVVLAQASMAGAAGEAGVDVPVLTSPGSGAGALVAAARTVRARASGAVGGPAAAGRPHPSPTRGSVAES